MGKHPDEAAITNRAMAAYFRRLGAEGAIPIQPANTSGIETVKRKQYVVLRNVNGILAVYRIRNDGILKGLKRWPTALEKY